MQICGNVAGFVAAGLKAAALTLLLAAAAPAAWFQLGSTILVYLLEVTYFILGTYFILNAKCI